MKRLVLPVLMASLAGLGASAQEKKPSRAEVDSSNTVRLNYGYPAWNKDATKVDSASLLMREGTTGRIVQIHLDEDAPNSSIFSGLFSINWQNIDKLQVEFYIPPQDLLNSNDGLRKLGSMIAKKELKRKPFLLRRTPGSVQMIEIFDSVDQAQYAMKAYREEQQLLSMSGLKNKAYPSNQEIDVAKLALHSKDRAAAAKARAERVRMLQLEVQRMRELITKFAALSPDQRAEQKKTAERLANEALNAFRLNNFDEASKKYKEAITLDPDTPAYIFYYGIAQYRLNQYNQSLVFLQLAEGGAGVNETERQYYMGLNYFGLRDFDNADVAFDKVIEQKSSSLSSSARFYKGVTKYEMKEWDAAQAAFQSVLDNSSDAELDKQAEAYIENILRTRQFEAERAKKWELNLMIGEMVDSNVLLTSTSALDTGQASELLGYRTLLMGSLRYRPVYDEMNEFAVQANVLHMYTLDKTFKRDQQLTNADPTILSIAAPWSLKSTAFGYGYKLDLSPGYETIVMSVEDNESKPIISSMIMNVNNLVVMNPNWFATWNVESRRDFSHLNAATGDNDSNAFKVKLVNMNTFIVNEAKNKFVTAEVGYTMNQALGKEATYNRVDLSGGYLQPFKWDTVANMKLDYFYLNYPTHSSSRADHNVTATLGATKQISEKLNAGVSGSYSLNTSNVDTSSYKKWTMLFTLGMTTGL